MKPPEAPAAGGVSRLRLSLHGAVQGVGFRPFVYRLAAELGISGWACNGPAGLLIEAEAAPDTLKLFGARLLREKPDASFVASVEETWLAPAGERGFTLRASRAAPRRSAWVLPDLALCPDCRREVEDPEQRRGGYPFANCTRCGPRFTIVTDIPYDRASTTMASFPLCADCRREFEDPADRRFHAQPIACPACGPSLTLEEDGGVLAADAALARAAELISGGRTVALKGIGGYLLLCDARSEAAVSRLRLRKRRQEKPFAVLFPSLEAVRAACEVSPQEEEWLSSSAAPIVLLERRPAAGLCADVAPGSAWVGAMLPYAPLHHLLCRRAPFPLVATSGNLSEEPIAHEDHDARRRLKDVCDAFLTHDRPIARHADDSIVRRVRGRQAVLRRARGLAPLPLAAPGPLRPTLALGAQLKSTVALAWEDRIVVSQHLGDLETAACRDAFERAARDLAALHGVEPSRAACDLHPEYASTRFAEALGLPLSRVQHHHAHVAACVAELGLATPVLGVAFDGAGYGPDGTVWGGEFLRVDAAGYRRAAHLRTFPLPGGDAAAREPRRAALGLLAEAGLDLERVRARFEPAAWAAVRALPGARGLSPRCSSAGRLFDAAAALAGLRQVNAFEGQAAMALEQAAAGVDPGEGYPLPAWVRPGAPIVLDWAPLITALLADVDRGAPAGLIAARFHEGLARAVRAVARLSGLERVVLTGGVFQNRLLVERACALLEADGFSAFTPQRLPANDGGISAGQAFIAGRGWGTAWLEGPCA